MIGRRLVNYAKPRTRPEIVRPRTKREIFNRSFWIPCGSRHPTRRTDSPLPLNDPIGLLNRWKPNGKDFLIIVNRRCENATVFGTGSRGHRNNGWFLQMFFQQQRDTGKVIHRYPQATGHGRGARVPKDRAL